MQEVKVGQGRFLGGPVTDDEVKLLHDMQGFIDFALRNGISFLSAIATLGHDVNGLSRFGFDLDQAKKGGFLPKVTGFSEVGVDSVGEVDEGVESE